MDITCIFSLNSSGLQQVQELAAQQQLSAPQGAKTVGNLTVAKVLGATLTLETESKKNLLQTTPGWFPIFWIKNPLKCLSLPDTMNSICL